MNALQRLGLLLTVAFALALSPASAKAQVKATKTYPLTVGHVVHVAWTASVSTGVTYNVYASNTSGGPYILIGQTALLTFADLNATSGNTYYYVVTSVDSSGGESVYSSEVSVVIPVP